jgi:DNA ligase-1
VWEEDMNPTGWLMSEKFDGIRLFWNGTSFYTRQGKKLNVPESITSKMPTFALDGELWTQYGLYQEPVVLCNTSDENKWKKAVFLVFDAPDISHKPYEVFFSMLLNLTVKERVEFLQNLPESSFVKVVSIVKCEGKEHLAKYFKEIVAKGGEGVMLREPGSLYRGGRSTSSRKYKEFFDSEVKVLETNFPYGFDCLQ